MENERGNGTHHLAVVSEQDLYVEVMEIKHMCRELDYLEEVAWCMLFAGDIVLVDESRDGVNDLWSRMLDN